MVRPYFRINLTPEEVQDLVAFMSAMVSERDLAARTRAQAVWYSHQGWTIRRISQAVKASWRTVWSWLKAYQSKGLAGLRGRHRRLHLRTQPSQRTTSLPPQPSPTSRVPSAEQLPTVLTLRETAAYLRLSPATVYRLVQQGKLPAVKLGRQWRFRKEEVANYLAVLVSH